MQVRERVKNAAERVVDLLLDLVDDLRCDLEPGLAKSPVLRRQRVEVYVVRCGGIRNVLAGGRVEAARILRSLERSTGLACMLISDAK